MFQRDQLHHGDVDVRRRNERSTRKDVSNSTVEPVLEDNRQTAAWIHQRVGHHSTCHRLLHADGDGNAITPSKWSWTGRNLFQPTNEKRNGDVERKIAEQMNRRRCGRFIGFPQLRLSDEIVRNHRFDVEIQNIAVIQFQTGIDRVGQRLKHRWTRFVRSTKFVLRVTPETVGYLSRSRPRVRHRVRITFVWFHPARDRLRWRILNENGGESSWFCTFDSPTSVSTYCFRYCPHKWQIYSSPEDRVENSARNVAERGVCRCATDRPHSASVEASSSECNPSIESKIRSKFFIFWLNSVWWF